jgi:hypothetical protein
VASTIPALASAGGVAHRGVDDALTWNARGLEPPTSAVYRLRSKVVRSLWLSRMQSHLEVSSAAAWAVNAQQTHVGG